MINPPTTDRLEEIPTIPTTLMTMALQAEDLQEGARLVTRIHGDLGCLGDHMPHQEDCPADRQEQATQ